ncbi:MAG: SDR family oxidoreductase [Pseudomonadota bacterium]
MKVALLGGSRGIGAAIVRHLTKDDHEVAFTYFGSAEAAARVANDSSATAAKVDSADRQGVRAWLDDLAPIDALIVNAGIGVTGDPLATDPDEIDRMIDVNLRGPWHAAVDAARVMNEGGRIVFIGSVNGERMPGPGGAAYAMTKAGLIGATKGLARDFGPRGITVNTVQPGPVDTDMNPADGAHVKLMYQAMAIRRHAEPAEVASLVAYLLSPAAAMITGGTLNIDGGFAA